MFVNQFADHYGTNMLVYNVHNLVTDVKRFGPLERFSAFAFENFLGRIKTMLRKPHAPLSQVIRRLSERKGLTFACKSKTTSVNLPRNKHRIGPLPYEYRKYSQFSDIYWGDMNFSIREADNCVRVGCEVGLIRNIIQSKGGEVRFLYEPFRTVSDFFDFPLPSSDLGILKVSKLTGTLKSALFLIESILLLYLFFTRFVRGVMVQKAYKDYYLVRQVKNCFTYS